MYEKYEPGAIIGHLDFISTAKIYVDWGSNNEVIVVRCGGETLISENTNFSYDEKYNVCNISPSVVLHQLFNDGSIMIKFFVKNLFKF